MEIIYIILAFMAGCLLFFFILNGRIQKHKLENSARLSQEEVKLNYVNRDLHNSLAENLAKAQLALEKEISDNDSHQATILRITGESQNKFTKDEVEKNYVGRESFEIINGKLVESKQDISKKDETILKLTRDLESFQRKEEHLNEKLTTFKRELEELHTRSQTEFKNLANDVLEEKKKNFVDENKKELKNILDPFKGDLDTFKQKVEDTRKEDIADLTSLKKEIGSLQQLNYQLSEDARNLSTALKSEVKMQGNWGEDRLNMILEVEGLQKHIDFTREDMYRDDEQEKNRKPDFILKLPNGKHIIIDSKVSLTAYVNYFNAPTAEEKMEQLRLHLRSVTDHVNNLADKNYQSLVGLTTPDYVFMFMPVESALTLALNQNPEIFNNALKRKIVLITPTTLVATLKIVKILWQKENQVKNVEEIFRQCGELYNKFASFLEDMDRVESALNSATKAHNDAMNSLKDGSRRGNTIIGRFENIRKLEAKTNKIIPAKHLNEIELLPDDNEIVILDTGTSISEVIPEE